MLLKHVYCFPFQVCVGQPNTADQKGSFFTGCSSFRKANMQSHAASVRHTMSAQAQKAEVAAHPAHRPMDLLIRKMESDQREQLLRLVNTAYHVAKLELPFASFPSLLSLQTKNGLEIGLSYKSDKACSRYDFSVENKIQKKKRSTFSCHIYACCFCFITSLSQVCRYEH